jgi:hypothetical protein
MVKMKNRTRVNPNANSRALILFWLVGSPVAMAALLALFNVF